MSAKIVDVAAAVIARPDGTFLLGQRAADTYYPGYWEFPGGKVESGETPHDALRRELREELGIAVVRAYPWITREHRYEHAHVRLHFFRVLEWRGEIHDHIHAALAWQHIDQPIVEPMLPANGPVLRALALPDFYAITHASEIGVERQLALAENAFKSGLRLIQVREKTMASADRARLAQALIARARLHGAQVLINGDQVQAQEIGADGVQLTSLQLATTDRRPPFPLVGASCHTAAELALALQLDFVVLGPVMPTASHPHQPAMGWTAFARLVENYPLPVYAIGGLGRDDLEQAWCHGAHGIAAIRGAWGAR